MPTVVDVTILVSNYHAIPHPDPAVNAQLDAALRGFDAALRYMLQFVNVPAGSKLAIVDLYTPPVDREGLLLIDLALDYQGPFNFEIHPTNLGHAFIAEQFEKAWLALQ